MAKTPVKAPSVPLPASTTEPNSAQVAQEQQGRPRRQSTVPLCRFQGPPSSVFPASSPPLSKSRNYNDLLQVTGKAATVTEELPRRSPVETRLPSLEPPPLPTSTLQRSTRSAKAQSLMSVVVVPSVEIARPSSRRGGSEMQTFGQEIEDVVATSMEDIPVPASAEGYDAMVTDEALSTQGQAKGIPVPSEDVSAQLEDSVIKLEYQRNDGERRHASARSTPSTCKPGRARKEAIHVSDEAIEGVDDAPLAAKEIGEANQADGDADTGPAKRKRRPTAKKEASSVLDRDSDASGEALRATAEKKGAKATRGRVSSRAKPSAMGVLDADLTASLPDETRQLGNRLAPKGFKFVRQRNECRYQGWRKLHRCCGCRNNPRATILDEVCLLKNIRYFLRAEDEARPPQIGGHLGEYIPAPHPVTGVVEYYIYAPNAVKVLDLPSPSSFNVAMTPDNIGLIKAVTAHALLPTMREELAHARQPDVVVMNPPPVYRNPCDCCRTATFNASFICSHCGREYCLRCFAAAKVAYATRYPEASLEPSTDDKAIANVENLDSDAQDHLLACQRPAGMRHDLATPLFNYSKYTKEDFHSPALFAPLSRRSAAHLEQIVKELEAVDTSPREAVACLSSPVTEYDAVTYLDPTEETSLPIAYIDNADLSDEIFNRLWRTGEPFVARGVVSKEGVWTPEYIIKSFGDDLCQVERCRDGQLIDKSGTRVRDFFGQFGKGKTGKFIESCRNKDFPPTDDFMSVFPDEYKDFLKILPAQAFTRPDGAMNINAMFALNGARVDLGPKGYNATKGDHDRPDGGSTRLHCDVADAVNEAPFAMTAAGEPGSAVWNLWRADDAQKLREYLFFWEARNRKGGETPTEANITAVKASWDDPIHSQQVYVSRDMRKELFKMHGVKTFEIRQEAGQAVFIPAGCPHQVSNDADCIKVAIDFVSPHNIERIVKITRELRTCSWAQSYKEDILALNYQLYYAFETCLAIEREWAKTPVNPNTVVVHRLVQRPPPPDKPKKHRPTAVKAQLARRVSAATEASTSTSSMGSAAASTSMTTLDEASEKTSKRARTAGLEATSALYALTMADSVKLGRRASTLQGPERYREDESPGFTIDAPSKGHSGKAVAARPSKPLAAVAAVAKKKSVKRRREEKSSPEPDAHGSDDFSLPAPKSSSKKRARTDPPVAARPTSTRRTKTPAAVEVDQDMSMQVHGETKEDRLLRLLQLTRSAMDDYTEERDEQGLLPFDPNIGDVLVQHFFHPVQAERRRQRGEAPAEKVAPLEQFDATALKELEVRLAGVKGGIDGLEKEVGAIKSGARS